MGQATTTNVLRDGSWQRRLTFSLSSWVTLGLLIAAVVINAALQPTFFTTYSITSNFATFAPLILAAIGQAIVVIGGGLDLSLGAIVALSSVVSLQVMGGDPSKVGLGVVAAAATGALCGAVNGFIISVIRLQPLIATFATSSVFSGLALVVLPSPGGTVPATITEGYRGAVLGIPVPVVVAVMGLAIWFVLSHTKLMRHIRAVGGNRESAFASLVPVGPSVWASYTLAGLMGGLAALTILANTGSGDPFIGSDIAMNSIAGVVLGGIALSGGRGSAVGAVGGALILAIVTNILSFMGVPTTYRQLISGVVIIAALALSVTMLRKEGTR